MHLQTKFTKFVVMNRIAKHISTLLYSHDCVIIPTLGGFVANYRDTKIDEDRNIFTPPGKEIGFNRSLQHDDGLLVSVVSRKNNISYEAAKETVYNFANEIKSQLNLGETFAIENVGKLKLDAMSNLQFIADSTDSFMADAFGLTSFHFAPAEPAPKQHEITRANTTRFIKSLPHRQVAASAALVVGLFALTPEINNTSSSSDYNSASIIPLSVKTIKAKPIATATNYEVSSEEISETVEITPIEIKKKFFIIAASFKKRSKAQLFVNKLIQRGEVEASIIEGTKNRFRVAVNGAAGRAEATKLLKSYRSKKAFQSVWLLAHK